jgi:hypothetical protein
MHNTSEREERRELRSENGERGENEDIQHFVKKKSLLINRINKLCVWSNDGCPGFP